MCVQESERGSERGRDKEIERAKSEKEDIGREIFPVREKRKKRKEEGRVRILRGLTSGDGELYEPVFFKNRVGFL